MSQRAGNFMETLPVDGLVEFYLEHRDEIEATADDRLLFTIGFIDHILIATKKELVNELGHSPEAMEQILEKLTRSSLVIRTGNQYVVTEKGSKLLSEIGLKGHAKQDKIRVLIAEDEENFARLLTEELAREGHATDVASDARDALEKLKGREFDVVLVDFKIPKVSGMDILKEARKMALPPEVILLTGHGTIPTAVEAMKLGAFTYVTKPFNTAELNLLIRKAYEKQQILRENLYLKARLEQKETSPDIVTASPKMRQILKTLVQIGPTDTTVLITGESGTGKELIARALHFSSGRKDRPFLAISCGAIPESLLESELFGHVKGAFTGAVTAKEGLFEVADGGTVFLDEIGETSPAIQVKLLRVLQERVFRRIGGTKDIQVDVRVIAATNQDLKELIHKGRFREDLYYRLNVIPINLPPLRERAEDIPVLAEYFLRTGSARWRHKMESISKEAMALLTSYLWPGNIRELQLVIERAVVLARGGTLMPEDLPPDLLLFRDAKAPTGPTKNTLAEMERILIRRALENAHGDRRQAAAALGLNLAKLREKLKAYKLVPSEKALH